MINKASCDIKPGCSRLVPVIRWPHPKVQAGMLAGPSALEYGPVKVTASGDDAVPAVRVFEFDYQAEPMLYDLAVPTPKKKQEGIVALGVVISIIALVGIADWLFRPKQDLITSASTSKDLPKFDDNLESKAGKYIFLCSAPPVSDKRNHKELLAVIRANAQTLGDTFGFLIIVSEITHGIRLELTPKTREIALRMGVMTKLIYEVRRVDTQLYVSISMEAPDPLGLILQLMPIDPEDKTTVSLRKATERIVGAPEGACKIL
jgi:hypothetical protein